MSIINEALKKTEQNIQKNAEKVNLPVSSKPGPLPVLLYTLILLAGLFLGNIMFNLLRYKVKPANTSASSQQPLVLTALPAAPALPSEEKKIPETSLPQNNQALVLNGIFFSDNDGYALINNQIVRENDLVDGAKVIKIAANNVELDREGKIITLSTLR